MRKAFHLPVDQLLRLLVGLGLHEALQVVGVVIVVGLPLVQFRKQLYGLLKFLIFEVFDGQLLLLRAGLGVGLLWQ